MLAHFGAGGWVWGFGGVGGGGSPPLGSISLLDGLIQHWVTSIHKYTTYEQVAGSLAMVSLCLLRGSYVGCVCVCVRGYKNFMHTHVHYDIIFMRIFIINIFVYTRVRISFFGNFLLVVRV